MMATAASKRASKKTVVSTTSQGRQQPQLMPLEDVLNLLLVGFTRGAAAPFAGIRQQSFEKKS